MRMQVIAARTPEWSAVVRRARELVDDSAFRSLKRSARTVAGFAMVDGTSVFIKRVDEGSWLKGWISRLRGSRARRVLRGEVRGPIPTLEPGHLPASAGRDPGHD